MPRASKKKLLSQTSTINNIVDGLAHMVRPIADLIYDPMNARLHPERNLESIKGSLSRYGQRTPIVVNLRTMHVEKGNGTLEAMRALGWTQAAVLLVDDDEITAIGYGMADNRSSDLAQANLEAVDRLSRIMEAAGENVVGWTLDELEVLRMNDWSAPAVSAEDPGARVDYALELQRKWKTELGQLWVVGRHRLLCGDSREMMGLTTVLNKVPPTLVFTDPPYGVSIAGKNRLLNSVQPYRRRSVDMEDDMLPADELKSRLLPVFTNIRKVMADDCTVMITSPQGGELGMMMMMMMKDAGLPIRHVLIWVKNAPTFSLGRLDYDYQHEPILFTWCKKHKKRDYGDFRTSIWSIDNPSASPHHPTIKPVELYVNAIKRHTDAGDVILDPYCGSGTALVAAEQTGRVGCGVEISPGYVAVALDRLSRMGLEPRLEG